MAETLMTENLSIATRVIEAIIGTGLVTEDQVAALRDVSSDDAGVGRELVVSGYVTSDQLSEVLEAEMGFPCVDLSSYAPDEEALALIDPQVARDYRVLPLFEIEGTLTVAIGEPQDIFLLDAIGLQLDRALDAVLGGEQAVSQAVGMHFPEQSVPAAVDEGHYTDDSLVSVFEPGVIDEAPVFASSVPADADETESGFARNVEQVIESAAASEDASIDLDVLAFADEGKVAVLVSEILEHAVRRGASRIHLLPYKSDFFLVFRIRGRLEKIASAPLSMQRPLVDGFKSFARLDSVGADRPALGRVHVDVAGKALTLTVSEVPTVAGHRLVVSMSARRPQPKDLSELGIGDAESRVLHAMVERGRGLLLVAAPVSGGRSTTYYSLLHHAAQAGKTVYSVERSIGCEIPAVAQVLVSPGQPIPAAGYLAVGMRQDTDVMGLDSVHSVEEIHLAIEAASLGKLVVVTFAAGGIVDGVRRLLDLGAEPVSLANALTLGVGQRVARSNCPECLVDDMSELVSWLPGGSEVQAHRSAGCAACGGIGFAGATGVFEVLPFSEPVRASIARNSSAVEIAAAATAAGMRPMIAAGLSKVQAGLVSVEELDRVLRFAE